MHIFHTNTYGMHQACKVYNISVFSSSRYVVFVAIVSHMGFSNHCRMWNSNLHESRVINKATRRSVEHWTRALTALG